MRRSDTEIRQKIGEIDEIYEQYRITNHRPWIRRTDAYIGELQWVMRTNCIEEDIRERIRMFDEMREQSRDSDDRMLATISDSAGNALRWVIHEEE